MAAFLCGTLYAMTDVRLTDLVDPDKLAQLRALADGDDGPAGPETKGMEFKADDAAGELEHKADPGVGGAQVLSVDDDTGLVEALVSVTGVEDKVKDTIEPGAYTKTLGKHEPIGVWSHDDKTWVARTEEAVELMPGDPFFKGLKTMDGQPWPKEAGAVKVKARFNLDTTHGREAYSDVKFFQGKTGWSIGYRATKAQRNPRTGQRSIKELDWFEYSPVMVGAASQPMTLSVKSLSQPVDPDAHVDLVDVEALTDAEVKARDELRSWLETKATAAALETKDIVRTPEGARRFGQPIGTRIVKDRIPASALKVGDEVDFQGGAPGMGASPVKGHVEKVDVGSDTVVITVNGKDHKLGRNDPIDVQRALPSGQTMSGGSGPKTQGEHKAQLDAVPEGGVVTVKMSTGSDRTFTKDKDGAFTIGTGSRNGGATSSGAGTSGTIEADQLARILATAEGNGTEVTYPRTMKEKSPAQGSTQAERVAAAGPLKMPDPSLLKPTGSPAKTPDDHAGKTPARAAIEDADSLLESLREEEGDHGPRGWDTQMDDWNAELASIRKKEGEGKPVSDDLNAFADDLENNVSTGKHDDLLAEVVASLRAAASSKGGSAGPDPAKMDDEAIAQERGKVQSAIEKERARLIGDGWMDSGKPDGRPTPELDKLEDRNDALAFEAHKRVGLADPADGVRRDVGPDMAPRAPRARPVQGFDAAKRTSNGNPPGKEYHAQLTHRFGMTRDESGDVRALTGAGQWDYWTARQEGRSHKQALNRGGGQGRVRGRAPAGYAESGAADQRVKDQAKLAAINKRRRARGQLPLNRLPDQTKELWDLEDIEAKLLELELLDDAEFKALAHESLDRSPRSNWVEKAGQLPAYIQHIAKDLHEERGMDMSRAIATAISRCKVWAAGGDGVKPDTQAKAAKAIAEWEALKAKSHLKYDSELLEELEQKALDTLEAIEDAWAFLYEAGEFKAQVGTAEEYIRVDAETGETIGVATVPDDVEPVTEVKSGDAGDTVELSASELLAATQLRRGLLG